MANKASINFKDYGLEPVEEETPIAQENPNYQSYGLTAVDDSKAPSTGSNVQATIDLLKKMPGMVGGVGQVADVAQRVPGAIGQVGQDVWNVAKAIPGAATKAYGDIPKDIDFLKEAFPAAWEMIKNNPAQAAKNVGAGAVEFGGRVSRVPPALADYLAHIGMIKPETAQAMPRPFSEQEVSGAMDQFVGDTENKGGQLLRGALRNADLVSGGAKLASLANPLKLTDKALAKEIVKTEGAQVGKHSSMYDSIWNEARRSGFNNVPADLQNLSDKLGVIEKYKTPREYQALHDFILDPTLENAQKAQSDMGQIARKMEEKSRGSSLTTEEKSVYEAAKGAEKHIEQNMFKDAKGNVNQDLQDKYQKVTQSYRENVVPYKYNTDIQAFKNREMLAKELMARLKGGEFRAKKGSAHPRIAIKELLKPLGVGVGVVGGGSYLLDLLKRNRETGFSGGESNGGK